MCSEEGRHACMRACRHAGRRAGHQHPAPRPGPGLPSRARAHGRLPACRPPPSVRDSRPRPRRPRPAAPQRPRAPRTQWNGAGPAPARPGRLPGRGLPPRGAVLHVPGRPPASPPPAGPPRRAEPVERSEPRKGARRGRGPAAPPPPGAQASPRSPPSRPPAVARTPSAPGANPLGGPGGASADFLRRPLRAPRSAARSPEAAMLGEGARTQRTRMRRSRDSSRPPARRPACLWGSR